MRFSKFVIGLLTFDTSIGTASSVVVEWIKKDLDDSLRQDSDFITYYDRALAEISRLWEVSGNTPILESKCKLLGLLDASEYKSVLETLFAAAQILPIQTISGSPNEICLLGQIVAEMQRIMRMKRDDDEHLFGLQERVDQVVRAFWRNHIAEHFIKDGEYDTFFVTHRKHRFGASSPLLHNQNLEWMRFLVDRCGIVAEEIFYLFSYKRMGWIRFGRTKMDKGELHTLCEIVRDLLSQYKTVGEDGQISTRHYYGWQKVEIKEHLSRALQICNKEELLLTESVISNRIANLNMNEEELGRYCEFLGMRPQAGDVAMMQLGLDIFERQLNDRFENLKFHTGHNLPRAIEVKFYSFVDQASLRFSLESVLATWTHDSPFDPVEPTQKVCNVAADPPRLSRARYPWDRMTDVFTTQYFGWTMENRGEFCQIVNRFELNIEDARTSLELFLINILLPHTKSLCGQVTRTFAHGTDPTELDWLVAEAGKDKACPFITQWNRDKTVTDAELVTQLRAAADGTAVYAAGRVRALPFGYLRRKVRL